MHDGATGANAGGDEGRGDPAAGGAGRLADWWTGLDRGWQAAALGFLVVLGHVLVRVA
jgi:hypothetical protein